MTPETKDQVAGEVAGGQSDEKVPSLDERFDAGWEQVELATEQENAAKAKAKEGQPPVGETKKEAEDSTSKPYEVLKVGGKDYPVKTKEELRELAQKGADYTKKTQTLADDRRDAEAQVKKESDRLADASEKMVAQIDRLIAAKVLPADFTVEKGKEAPKAKADGTISEDLAKVYEEFQLDPANAYPYEKKHVEEVYANRKALAELREERRLEKAERAEEIIQTTISKERESFPFDDIVDDQGNDTTRNKIKALVATKKALSGVETPAVEQVLGWLKEAVHELHIAQKGNGVPDVSDDMDPTEFSKKYPGLAKKLQGSAVEKDKAERAKLPPTLTPGKREIDPTKRPGQKAAKEGSKSLEDYLDAGFKDPDVLKSFGG